MAHAHAGGIVMCFNSFMIFVLQGKLPDGLGIVGGVSAIFILRQKVINRPGIALVIA